MKIKSFSLLFALAFVSTVSATSARASEWETNYPAALARAAKENKIVLLNFTGSDWCGWCKVMVEETFSKPEFGKFADAELVLAEVDFPEQKPQSPELRKQNSNLESKFDVKGYPTLVLLNSQGREIARNSGYLPGGPEAFIKWVKTAML